MRLHFINQRVIIFTLIVYLSHNTGRTPQSIFSFVSRNENFGEWRVHFEFVFTEFLPFVAGIWRECCPITRQKYGVGEFLLFASFNIYDYFSEGNTCFINSQSLTACQKQTTQVIKISRHGFLEKGVKKTAMLIASFRSSATGNELEPLYFGKSGAIFGKQ